MLFTVFILTLSADRAGAALLLPRLPEPGSRVLSRAWGAGGGAWFGGGGVLWVGPVCLRPAGELPSLQVSECGWAARRAPSLRSLYSLCRNMHAWLRQDPGNVCVVHCVVSKLPRPGTLRGQRGRAEGQAGAAGCPEW